MMLSKNLILSGRNEAEHLGFPREERPRERRPRGSMP